MQSILFAECHVRYIVESLRALLEQGASRLEIRPEAVAAFVDEVSAELESYIWSLPGIDNWMKGERDRVTAVTSKRIIDVWHDSREPDRRAYTWS